MARLRRVTIARCPGGHAFVVTRGCRKYCSEACATEFAPERGPLHFQHPAWEQPREACGQGRLSPRLTTVLIDVECGNCKRTDAWKKAVAS